MSHAPEPADTEARGPQAAEPPAADKPTPGQRLRQSTDSRIRKTLGKVWTTGGGGFYGTGYMVYFLYLEAQLLLEDIGEASGVVDFVTGQLIERVLRFAIDSIANMVKAFIWPALVIADWEVWGIAMLVVGSLLYARFLHQRLVNYLGIDPEADNKARKAAKKAKKAAQKAESKAAKTAKNKKGVA